MGWAREEEMGQVRQYWLDNTKEHAEADSCLRVLNLAWILYGLSNWNKQPCSVISTHLFALLLFHQK